MCFSVNVNLVKEELEKRYGAKLIDPDKYRPSYYYHAFSMPELPAVCSNRPDQIQMLRWGLVPSWVKSAEEASVISLKTFNARRESLLNKPSFSEPFKLKRCLIPVKGFFEWQHNGKIKTPWYIYQADNEIMSLGGLYDDWTDKQTGLNLRTFTVVTTDANDMLASIHNSKLRMPVIFDRKSETRWIDQSCSLDDAMKLLEPISSDQLKAHTVGPLINSKTADKNTPEVIKPFLYNQQNLLF